jgi:hypothetical protein
MKYPITLKDSTTYYEKHFMLCDDTPHAYVSAFREAQYEAQRKRRVGTLVFWVITLGAVSAWLTGHLPVLLAAMTVVFAWALVNWRNRYETRMLAKTFEMALRGKEREFHEYMWRHLDRRMLRQDF